jgi:DNA adenine methylase
MAKWLISHFPPHRIYVEPYGGAASVLLLKQPSRTDVYNDLDEEIVNVFRVLRNSSQADELRRLLFLTPFARSEYDLSMEPSGDPVEMARRTIVRSFMGHGSNAAIARYKSGFRSRRKGFAGPERDWKNYFDCVPAFVNRLRQIVIECCPAMELIARYDSPDTLFYIDPPYLLESRTSPKNGYRYEMTVADHEELAERLHNISGMAVVSGYDSDLYNVLYGDWPVFSITSHADSISLGKGGFRTEFLWLSPSAQGRKPFRFIWE